MTINIAFTILVLITIVFLILLRSTITTIREADKKIIDITKKKQSKKKNNSSQFSETRSKHQDSEASVSLSRESFPWLGVSIPFLCSWSPWGLDHHHQQQQHHHHHHHHHHGDFAGAIEGLL